MSEIKESQDFPHFASSRPSTAAKKTQAEAEEASSDQSDAMLTEIHSLVNCTIFDTDVPKWLDLTPETHFEIEQAHRSLGPVPGADHAPRSV